jgi:molybdopterin molybdotransferase
MAQLSADQFTLADGLLTVEKALARVVKGLQPVPEVETVALLDADGRRLAADIPAPIDLPPFFNSAVDGYAVRHADLAAGGPSLLPVGARVPAGDPGLAVPAGQAVRIFTGAPMPPGLDTVFMQEDVRLAGAAVALPAGLSAGANCRPAGEDVAAGALALHAGELVTPERIALAAALGLTALPVRRRIRVAVFSTGNEIVSPGGARGPAQIYDANRFLLQALLRRLGAEVSDLGILGDDRAAIARALRQAASGHDLILTSGGVSAGEEDHVRSAVREVGSLDVWRLAIKPGRPVAMGVVPSTVPGQAAAFVGLPGNPVAVFVTFAHLVRPLLAALAGGRPAASPALRVSAAFSHRKKPDRREYLRAALRLTPDGAVEAVKHPQDGSGILTSLTQTDGLVELPEALEEVAPGDSVGFLSYALLR